MVFEIQNENDVSTPALLVYPRLVERNISRMLAHVDSPSRLCPHVKTHKCKKILRLFLSAGVRQFKCSTIAELEMVAGEGADFALQAVQPVGPAVDRVAQIAARYGDVEIAAVADNADSINAISQAAELHNVAITVFLDIDNGMGRTGIPCGDQAVDLCYQIENHAKLKFGGLHAYDGHIHDRDLAERRNRVESGMEGVLRLRDRVATVGMGNPKLIVGGTPSFPVHAEHADRICSPGTPVFWDAGYGKNFPDLEFTPAAILVTRVISKLASGRLCVDLGHKSVAAEMRPPRVEFLNVNVVKEHTHSEEHLVLEVQSDRELVVGDFLYAVPRHICPTVALHESLLVVEDGKVVDEWKVTARNRKLSF